MINFIKFALTFAFILCLTCIVNAQKIQVSTPYGNNPYHYNPYNVRQVYVFPTRTYPYYYQNYRVNFFVYENGLRERYYHYLMMKTYEHIINDVQNRGQSNK